jgi:glucose/mannose transport system permease protein
MQNFNRDRLYGFLVLLPSIVLLGIFVYWFIGQTFYWSLTDWGGTQALSVNPPKNYIELRNYEQLLTANDTQDLRFRIGMVNTFFFTALFMAGCLTLGFLLAVLLDQNIKGEGFFRTTFLFPMALSFAVTGTIWRWLLNSEGGINALPTLIGAKKLGFTWLANRQPWRFNWHEVPTTSLVLVIGLLVFIFISYIWRKKYLMAVYFGVPMFLIFMWMWSDFLTWQPEWDSMTSLQLSRESYSPMHGTFGWNSALKVVSAVIVIGFTLFFINRLGQGKRRGSIIAGAIAGALLVWYFTGGPDRLPMVSGYQLPMGLNIALIGIIIAAVWQLSGYTMAMYLAGIRGVPEELREAARVDGCNEVQVYSKIVLPMLKPITLSAMIVLGHISLKIFDLIFAMTGPDLLAVSVPGVQVYTAFRSNSFAKSSAIAVILLVMVAIVIVPYLVSSLRSEHDV